VNYLNNSSRRPTALTYNKGYPPVSLLFDPLEYLPFLWFQTTVTAICKGDCADFVAFEATELNADRGFICGLGMGIPSFLGERSDVFLRPVLGIREGEMMEAS